MIKGLASHWAFNCRYIMAISWHDGSGGREDLESHEAEVHGMDSKTRAPFLNPKSLKKLFRRNAYPE
ncbi:uncharacterized protein FTJAE_3446 [Fusarium tjaetaba]|uniref:Uncharacterized protein n=1 Tax=Fusarium tjaetaba TaxID=1567544 RepID=A0A8H5W2V5_9HYPO|nr:uncharacterized protein FTJAE_3446 [Fusarium tjaetaba]KAF5642904.1 hypothetical protein FTJAE_3446 [Fusarium tjaetaba]